MKASLRLYLCEDWLEGVIRLKAYTETHSCLTPCGDFINKSGSVSELGCSWAVAGLGWAQDCQKANSSLSRRLAAVE